MNQTNDMLLKRAEQSSAVAGRGGACLNAFGTSLREHDRFHLGGQLVQTVSDLDHQHSPTPRPTSARQHSSLRARSDEDLVRH